MEILKKKQEFLVVRCCDCKRFSVNLKTKSGKWQCKLCKKKQSIIKIYGISHKAKDCRLLLYDITKKAKQIEEQEAKSKHKNIKNASFNISNNNTNNNHNHTTHSNTTQQRQNVKPTSKWSKFLEDESDSSSDDNVDSKNVTFTTVDPRENIKNAFRTKKKQKAKQNRLDEIVQQTSQKFIRQEVPIQKSSFAKETLQLNKTHIAPNITLQRNTSNKTSKWDVFLQPKDNSDSDSDSD